MGGFEITHSQQNWLGLMIGNSRLHWGYFVNQTLNESWDTEHLTAPEILTNKFLNIQSKISVYLASVVPTQTSVWESYPNIHLITLNHIPLKGLYPTLGVDRALAVLGAGETLGFPVLVIDAGTALTFTGADANQNLVGGAILPGLRLQLKTLSQNTGALPIVDLPTELPPRFALNTPESIQSGIIYTILAGIKDFILTWQNQFPQSNIAITGGDRTLIFNYMQSQEPKIADRLISDPQLIFWGMRSLVCA